MTAKATTSATSLRALSDAQADGITKTTNFRVDPNLITFEEGFNLRQPGKEMDDHIDQLYKAYKAGAQIPPVDVTVAEGKIIARDGHCRTTAAKRYRKEVKEFTIECRNLRGNDVDAVLHMLGTGTGGKPLTPLEAGLGFLRLIVMGMTPAQIAEKLGKSRVTIDNGIVLAEAPAAVQKLILDGVVSATTARDAIKAGPEGIHALKEAAKNADEEEKKTPAAKKGKKASKKKKVTAKKLKGTKAEKKTKPRKSKEATPPPAAAADPDSITVSIPRDVATESVTRIKAAAAGPELKQLAAILENGLL